MSVDNIKEVRRAYLLARALNTQYQFVREFVNDDLRKIINEAKAKNAHFIKTIDQSFDKRNIQLQILQDEELAFQLLEALEKKDDPLNETNKSNKSDHENP